MADEVRRFENLLTKACGLIDSSEGRLVVAVELTKAHREEVAEARAEGVAQGRREMAQEAYTTFLQLTIHDFKRWLESRVKADAK